MNRSGPLQLPDLNCKIENKRHFENVRMYHDYTHVPVHKDG